MTDPYCEEEEGGLRHIMGLRNIEGNPKAPTTANPLVKIIGNGRNTKLVMLPRLEPHGNEWPTGWTPTSWMLAEAKGIWIAMQTKEV